MCCRLEIYESIGVQQRRLIGFFDALQFELKESARCVIAMGNEKKVSKCLGGLAHN